MISAPSTTRSGPHPILLWIFSSIGKKTIVALTGIVLLLFVSGHLLGNFTIYGGPAWVIRLVMLTVVGTHILFTMYLWMENQAARPKKYIASDPVSTTVFARTMRLTGLVVLAFIVFHLAHFTVHIIDPAFATMEYSLDGLQVHDCYKMVVTGFQVPWVSAVYIGGLFLLTSHLSHGIGSLFQTLGLTNRRLHTTIETVTKAYAWLLFFGFISIPISVLTGFVK